MKDNINISKGLTAQEVQDRISRFGYNELPTGKSRRLFKMMWDVVSEPMFLLLVSCAVLYLILGDLQEALVLSASVVIVMVIELVQERKTEHALEALKNLSSPRALVIRDGVQVRIPGREVVVDDLLVLAEGDRVPADALILQNNLLNADESMLTGESMPVRKRLWDEQEQPPIAGGDDLPSVYSGALIVSGMGIAKVYAIGEKTELGKIGKSLQGVKEEDTRLSKETGKLVKGFALFALFLCILVIVVFYISRGNLIDSLLMGITLAMSVLPEEFPVVLTVFMALGAWRMSRKHVLTRRTQAIENLGSATVLCTDKTGTLTKNKMTLQKVWSSAAPETLSKDKAGTLAETSRQTLIHSVLASMREPFDPMEKAIHAALNEADPASYTELQDLNPVKEYPLSDELRAMTNVWKREETGELLAAVKGSPEAVIGLCKMDADTTAKLLSQMSQMA